jgi:hypothetical protein
MGLTMRPSNTSLNAVSRAMSASRDELVSEWATWIVHRMAQGPRVDRQVLERQLRLLVDIVIQLTGPVRSKAAQLWFDACAHYGRIAAARGLAAGEVVEEIQRLRELLIRHLSDIIAALPARYAMATVLRLNRQVDKGIAQAVVGYTDALVETLFNQNGVAVFVQEEPDREIGKRLGQLETELAQVRASSDVQKSAVLQGDG